MLKLEEIIVLFEELKGYLTKYADNSISDSYNYLCNTLKILKANEFNNIEKTVRQAYKALYPAKGGLSDFYIWDDDYEKRCRLNEPLERIHKQLWKLVKNYI